VRARVFCAIRKGSAWVIRLEPLILLILAPLFLFPDPARSLVMLVVPLLWLCRRVATGRYIEPLPTNVVLLLMALMVLVSLYATFDIEFSLPKISGMAFGLAVYYAVVHHGRTKRRWLAALAGFLMTGLGVAALGLAGTNWPSKWPVLGHIPSEIPQFLSGLPGAESGFNANQVAGSLLWPLPVAVAITLGAILSWGHWRRALGLRRAVFLLIGLVLASLMLVVELALTQSRASYIGFLTVIPATVVLLIAQRHRRISLAVGFIMLLGIAPLLIAVVGQLGGEPLAELEAAGPVFRLRSMAGRLEIWSRALYGLQDFSFTGMGMNAFRRVVHVLYPLFSIAPETDVAHAHNNYLQAGLDLGIPGLIAYLALHMASFAMLAAAWRVR